VDPYGIPQTPDELIAKLVQEYLLTGAAPRVNELSVTTLTWLPSTWSAPHQLALKMSAELRKANRQFAASVLTDPGTLLLVLGDDVHGHVFAYTGSMASPQKAAYLIIRKEGFEWHAPLTKEESATAETDSLELEAKLTAAYDTRCHTVSYVVDHFHRLLGVPLEAMHDKIIMKLKRDLWELFVVNRADAEMMLIFATLCFEIDVLAQEYATTLVELVERAEQEMESNA
jgi:hypothetical protein